MLEKKDIFLLKRLSVENAEDVKFAIQSYLERHTESRFIHRLHNILLSINNEKASRDSIGYYFLNYDLFD